MTLQSGVPVLVNLPFLFAYQEAIYGDGFLAEVAIRHGRVLVKYEGERVCMYGVNPGDLAEGGKTLAEAHAEFRKSITAVLFDLALETNGFDEFRAAVESFVTTTNEPVLADWHEAVQDVRSLRIAERAEHDGLPVLPAESAVSIVVTKKQQNRLTAADNILEPEPALAA